LCPSTLKLQLDFVKSTEKDPYPKQAPLITAVVGSGNGSRDVPLVEFRLTTTSNTGVFSASFAVDTGYLGWVRTLCFGEPGLDAVFDAG
jgi:hypothetical protein